MTNLQYLAPDIQEDLLFLTRQTRARDPIHLARLQPIAVQIDWAKQRRVWRELCTVTGVTALVEPVRR